VSTRKLILLALACGLAILVAGSVQLLRIQRGESSTLALGDSTEVATVTASVIAAVADTDSVEVTVRMKVASTASSPIGDALVGWSLLTGGLKEPVEPVGDGAEAGAQPSVGDAVDAAPRCAGLRINAGETRDCLLSFPVAPGGAGTTYVTYRFAGQPATWSLPL